LAKGLDLLVGARVLGAELVTREAEDFELVGILFLDGCVELLEGAELGGEAALGGGVDDEDDLAFVGGEVEFGALFWRDISI
jgi:hypothetical protein